MTLNDERFMRRAIELSRLGFPAPNPHVGCVIVRDGVVLGEGYHHFAGDLHAEADALKHVEDARGATAYVTLEPCNHQGRQPPCSLALIAAGVKRVVIACPDENPRATGGASTLREAGIEVVENFLRDAAANANTQFLFSVANRRPLVVAKVAMSMDGRVALPSGASKWITHGLARRQGHRLRAELGAVLVGRRTVELDNPSLTARLKPKVHNQPTRIVLDSSNKLTGKESVFDDKAPTVHVTGRVDLYDLMADLHERGITGVLVEGGPTTIGHFAQHHLIDRIEMFLAPKILGMGKPWIETLMSDPNHPPERMWSFEDPKLLGGDVWITAHSTEAPWRNPDRSLS